MLILEFQEHRVNEEGREIFDGYDWWKELVSRAAQGADRFELRCWRTSAKESPSASSTASSRRAPPRSWSTPERSARRHWQRCLTGAWLPTGR